MRAGRPSRYLVACLGLAVLLLLHAPVRQGTVPPEIGKAIRDLKATFEGAGADMDGARVAAEVARHRESIDSILAYASDSPEGAKTLGDQLVASVSEFAERFRPGEPIDERWLAQSWRAGEQPEFGVTVDVYLLLEVAKSQESAAFTRRALGAVHDAMQANTYLVTTQLSHWVPEAKEELAQAAARGEGPDSRLGGEVAWCCEMFLVPMYLAEEPPLPAPAMEVLADFWNWRKDRMVEMRRPACLDWDSQSQTLAYVGRLLEAWPEDEE